VSAVPGRDIFCLGGFDGGVCKRTDYGIAWTNLSDGQAFGYSDIFGALAVELLQAVGYPDTLAICDGCGKAFIPAMRPSTSRRNYCKDCGHRAAIRDAACDLSGFGVPESMNDEARFIASNMP